MKIYNNIAVAAPNIMLPNKDVDLSKWAVIACDQYTSEPEYWNEVKNEVGNNPSTLNITLPEVYLGIENEEQHESRLASIKKNIADYMNSGIWNVLDNGFIVLDRATSLHPSRKGLMVAVDLEQYSYEVGNKERIRATEGTVISRIPPRVKIRANSPVELPHIMLLIDDPEGLVIEKAWDESIKSGAVPCYDTKLHGNSGSVKGYFIGDDSSIFEGIIEGFNKVLDKSADGMLFAVGDGNHSLASAKAHWENIKATLTSEEEKNTHPARFALAEVVNIHDKGLDFEPIHRVVFGVSLDSFKDEATKLFGKENISFDSAEGEENFIITDGNSKIAVALNNAPHSLAVGSVQILIDSMIKENSNISVDYIHGEDSVMKLSDDKNTGILLPDISKNAFFATIEKDGVFPRKTFSMGEAFEKRFYLEAKKITL